MMSVDPPHWRDPGIEKHLNLTKNITPYSGVSVGYSFEDKNEEEKYKKHIRFYYLEGNVFVTYIPYSDNWGNKRCKKKGCYGEMYLNDEGKKGHIHRFRNSRIL